MLKTNILKHYITRGQPAFGLFCSVPSPAIVERIACAGFQFVIIDTEHVLMNPETLESLLRTAETCEITSVVRVPRHDSEWVLKALDAGAQGILFPHISGSNQLKTAVQACRFYPEGKRSLSVNRMTGFGTHDLQEFLTQANKKILVSAMIEDCQGIENIAEIAAVSGLDMIMEGAADLSQALGLPWQTRHPKVCEAIRTIYRQAQQAYVPFCAFPRIPEDITLWWEQGVRIFLLGDERSIGYRALQAHLTTYQQHLSDI